MSQAAVFEPLPIERLYLGPGTYRGLGSELERLGVERALLLTGKTLSRGSLIQRVGAAAAGRTGAIFAGVAAHNPTSTVEAASAAFLEAGADGIVALLAVPLQPDGTAHVRGFTEEGKKEWISMWEKLRAEEESKDLPSHLARAYTKLESYALRLSLLLHETKLAEQRAASGAMPVTTRQTGMLLSMARRMDGEDDSEDVPVDAVVAFDEDSLIEADTVHDAWSSVEYFKGQLNLIHGRLAQTPFEQRIGRMLEWLKTHDGEATSGDMVRGKVAGCCRAAK
jgi:Iron-containing alcohol dehydrogenase